MNLFPSSPEATRGGDPYTAIRIGNATMMPGDVMLARGDGVLFIPPPLVKIVVQTKEIIILTDNVDPQHLQKGTYPPGQIDSK